MACGPAGAGARAGEAEGDEAPGAGRERSRARLQPLSIAASEPVPLEAEMDWTPRRHSTSEGGQSCDASALEAKGLGAHLLNGSQMSGGRGPPGVRSLPPRSPG